MRKKQCVAEDRAAPPPECARCGRTQELRDNLCAWCWNTLGGQAQAALAMDAHNHSAGKDHCLLCTMERLRGEVAFLTQQRDELHAALALYVEHFGDPLKVARAALAKAQGESK